MRMYKDYNSLVHFEVHFEVHFVHLASFQPQNRTPPSVWRNAAAQAARFAGPAC